ncbi:hypothetical protein E2493_04495 [Sphingomonas parva]|uniref:Peptidase A2 domain-containing protein n=1 Tax=Sphingomonas parva TaxID=2555898 RepID=A0A4Y8ZY39_9SPHN|nr:aspartyl protease family protein [Sphingomonas parva]TFI59456.1 hypothetical protein E2493_04495 [Sphingomonas parva]
MLLIAAALAAGSAAPDQARASAPPAAAKAPVRRVLPPPVQVGGPKTSAPGRVYRGRLRQPAERTPLRYETASGHIFFRVAANGQETWALLDSGAGMALIDLGFARSIGAALEAAPSVSQTASDGTVLPGTLAPDVEIVAPHQFETRMPLVALDLTDASRALGRPIGIVIGASLLNHLGVHIDPVRRELGFTRKGTKLGSDFTPLPLHEGRFVEMTIGKTGVRLAVDTGSDGAISLTRAAWARSGETAPALGTTTARGAGAGALRGVYTFVPQVTIGPFTERAVKVDIGDWPTAAQDGALGMGFLGRFTIVLDIGGGTLWLKPNGSGAAPAAAEAGASSPDAAAR